MAAAAAPALQQEGPCLFCLSEQFNDEYGSQPTRWVNHSCSNCLGPLVASVDLVEQDEWETLFHAACFEEMGRDFKISNAAKSVKLRGFPPRLMTTWMAHVKSDASNGSDPWDRELRVVRYCERGSCEKPGVGCKVRGWNFHTYRAMELLGGFHHIRQTGKDKGYGNIRRRRNSLKIMVPPGTLVERTWKNPNGVISSEVTFTFSTAKVVVTEDPPTTCKPKMSAAHPLDTSPETASLSRYPHIPPWACSQRDYVQFKFQQSLLQEPEIFIAQLEVPHVQHLLNAAATWKFPEPTMRQGWDRKGFLPRMPATARVFQHPLLTKAKAGFDTLADGKRMLAEQAARDAKKVALAAKKKQEEAYLEKRNERLRQLVMPDGRANLKKFHQYSPSKDPMFNGMHKAAGVKNAMELSEVPPPAKTPYQYDHWLTDFMQRPENAMLRRSKRRRR
eukprot:jgi/Tetstr1/436928/TSEL_025701.t1